MLGIVFVDVVVVVIWDVVLVDAQFVVQFVVVCVNCSLVDFVVLLDMYLYVFVVAVVVLDVVVVLHIVEIVVELVPHIFDVAIVVRHFVGLEKPHSCRVCLFVDVQLSFRTCHDGESVGSVFEMRSMGVSGRVRPVVHWEVTMAYYSRMRQVERNADFYFQERFSHGCSQLVRIVRTFLFSVPWRLPPNL